MPHRHPDRNLELDLEPALPETPNTVLDLLAPVLNAPILTVDRPPPTPASLLTLHRPDVEADFTEPPTIETDDEPTIPTRFTAGMSTLPHVDFPT